MRCRLVCFVTTVMTVLSTGFSAAASVRAGAPGAEPQGGVPARIAFGGTLPGAQGAINVSFALYADQSGGAPLWSETQTVIVDASGRYLVALGATLPDGLPSGLFVVNEPRWVGVQVAGHEELPRVALVSVPYAMKAEDATTLGGKPLSAFVLAGTTTGTGPDGLTSVDTRLLKNGLSAAGPLPQGAGTAGYIGVFTDTTNLGNSAIFQSGSSIGVGTLTPAAAFHSVASAAPGAFFDVFSNALGALPLVYRAARGTLGSPSAVQTDDILGGLAVRGYGATGFSAGRGQVMFRAAENWTDAANGTYLSMTTTPIGSGTWVERLRISPDGYVGLGTSAPLFPVDARLARGSTIARFGGVGTPLFAMAGEPQIGFNLYYEGAYKYGASAYGGYVGFNQAATGAFTFATAPSGVADATASPVVRMTILNNGRIAIGSHSPVETLDVAGNILSSGSMSGNYGYFAATGSGYYALRAQSLGTGGTRGVEGIVSSTTGTAGLFTNNGATGKALSAIVNGAEVMNATETGIHAGPGLTGTPLAFGIVRSNGVWLTQSHSLNISAINRTGTGMYQIAIASENLTYATHTPVVTLLSDVGFGFISYEFVSNTMFVFTTSIAGAAADRSFSFIIMKN